MRGSWMLRPRRYFERQRRILARRRWVPIGRGLDIEAARAARNDA